MTDAQFVVLVVLISAWGAANLFVLGSGIRKILQAVKRTLDR